MSDNRNDNDNTTTPSVATPPSDDSGSHDSFPATDIVSRASSPNAALDDAVQDSIDSDSHLTDVRGRRRFEQGLDDDSETLPPVKTDSLGSPTMTPLPTSPLDEDGTGGEGNPESASKDEEDTNEGLATPVDPSWARSRLAISEGEEEAPSPVRGEKERSQSSRGGDGEEESAVKPGPAGASTEDTSNVPLRPVFTLTKATLSGANETVSITQPSTPSARSDAGALDDAEESTTLDRKAKEQPPSITRIDTKLSSTFFHDTKHFFSSPAPMTAVSPKTAAFFDTSAGLRSPPRPGGAFITEIPSDVELATVEVSKSTVKAKWTTAQTIDEETDSFAEDSSRLTMNDQSRRPVPDPRSVPNPRSTRRDRLSPSNDPGTRRRSKSPSSRRRHDDRAYPRRDTKESRRHRDGSRSRSREDRQRPAQIEVDEEPELVRGPFVFSRTFVSTSTSTSVPELSKTRLDPVEIEGAVPSLSDVVKSVKSALRQDPLAYYTLKGVLAEFEEKKSQASSDPRCTGGYDRGERRTKDEPHPDVLRFADADELAVPRSRPTKLKLKEGSKIRSFFLTQTDTESEPETYDLRRPNKTAPSSPSSFPFQLERAHQGSRQAHLVPRRGVPADSPSYPTRLSSAKVIRRGHPGKVYRYPVGDTADRGAPVSTRSTRTRLDVSDSHARRPVDARPPSSGHNVEVATRNVRTSAPKDDGRFVASHGGRDQAIKADKTEEKDRDEESSRRKLDDVDIVSRKKSYKLKRRVIDGDLQDVPKLRRRHSTESISPRTSRTQALGHVPPSSETVPSTRAPIDADAAASLPRSLLLVNYLRDAAGVGEPEGRSKAIDAGRRRKAKEDRRERDKGEKRKKDVGGSKAKGKAKAPDRENSISFDFDDFY